MVVDDLDIMHVSVPPPKAQAHWAHAGPSGSPSKLAYKPTDCQKAFGIRTVGGMTDVLYDNLVRYAEGRPLRNVVDPKEGY